MGTLDKLRGCMQIPSKTDPMDSVVTHLLDLLKDQGESTSSLQALAAAVGCFQDDDELMVTSNVDQLLLHLVHTLMSCRDYKVRDMGQRQELKFVLTKKYSGCSHRPQDVWTGLGGLFQGMFGLNLTDF